MSLNKKDQRIRRSRQTRTRIAIQRVARLMKKKFPSLAEFSDPEHERGWAFLRIMPQVISIIDYSRGFGHSLLLKL